MSSANALPATARPRARSSGSTTFTPQQQKTTAIAADPTGNFVVTWDGYGQDGSFTGVFGQRFGRIVPVDLTNVSVE
jgi:hypothetical protein